MSIEAMKLALDALEEIHPGNMTPMAEEAWNKAITALRQAIEQAEQAQPVEWMTFIPLYSAPPVASNDTSQHCVAETAKQEHEPVIDKSAAIRIATALGWTPPRQWVGLTDEEIDNINYTSAHMLAREVEAKLKEKNT